jgi:hypothetical protein
MAVSPVLLLVMVLTAWTDLLVAGPLNQAAIRVPIEMLKGGGSERS